MSEERDVIVRLDDRVRLLSAVLAATDYPHKAQQRKPHGTHAHARSTQKYVNAHQTHPAVQATQSMLDSGIPLEALFALVMLMSWPQMDIAALPSWAPANYNGMLADFHSTADLSAFWSNEQSAWEKSLSEAQNVFKDVHFRAFFEPFLGAFEGQFHFIPNISYPTDYDVGFQLGADLICIAPPPLAWGESPPWPYDEPTLITHSYRAAMMVYGRILLANYMKLHEAAFKEITQSEIPTPEAFQARYPTWETQFEALFLSAVVAMYLEEHVDEREYKSYMLMEKKVGGMSVLPGTVSVLRRYLQEVGNGRYDNFIEFLPIFPKQLRVAQRMVTFS
jgi:hypothetical protein